MLDAPLVAELIQADGNLLTRRVRSGDRFWEPTTMRDRSDLPSDAPAPSRWWRSYLRGERPRQSGPPRRYVGAVDLFCGCGGLALGFAEAARALGLDVLFRLAVDVDSAALDVFAVNFSPLATLATGAGRIVEYQVEEWGEDARFAYPPELIHPVLSPARGVTDVVLAGPPCEGHSNLNNHTRRNDPRNLLLLDAIAIGVAVQTQAFLIENVPDIRNDRRGVLRTAQALLRSEGYRCTSGVLAGDRLGLPQRRRRFFLAASKGDISPLSAVEAAFHRSPTTVRWAIEDLASPTHRCGVLDIPAELSPENRRRIRYLFEHDAYELPEHIRPECHRNGHTYPSVYGRLRWDEPSGTITTGFVSPGRGRFVHPSEPRTLTPHEAARIQCFPDWFSFVVNPKNPPSKAQLTKWIGDAVPPTLAYVAAMTILPGLSND